MQRAEGLHRWQNSTRKFQIQQEENVEAKVEVKMTPKIMYDFMMYHTYRSFSGIFGIILGIAAFVMFGMTLGKTELSYSMVYCLFPDCFFR